MRRNFFVLKRHDGDRRTLAIAYLDSDNPKSHSYLALTEPIVFPSVNFRVSVDVIV